MKKYSAAFLSNLSIVICLFLGANNLSAANRNTVAAGNWSSNSTWNGTSSVPASNDNVTIDHAVNLDANWGPQNSGTIVFNAPSSGSGTLNMSGGSLTINANVTLTGTGVNLTGGSILIKSGYTLTIPGFNQANTNIVVEFGATLVVNGDYLNNHGDALVNGLITVNGNYNGHAPDATVTGIGNIISEGSMSGINNSSIFGTLNPYCPSNCDGRSLFGGGDCTGTADAFPNVTSICLGGTVSFTSTLTGGYGNSFTKLYQWQIKNSSNVFVNISNATNSTYSATPSVSSTYRVIIGEKRNLGDVIYCYKTSPAVAITVTSCPFIWTGTTSRAWSLASNWNLGFVPTSTSTVIIPATVTSTRMPEISATFNIGSLENYGVLTSTGSSTINVYGNILNNGSITATSGATSTINMVGTTAQTISGTSPTTIHNLSINNSAGVSLLSALTINGTLSLTNGVLTTNNNLTINFDAGGNIGYNPLDDGTIIGEVSGVRYLSARSHYISVPFEGITSGDINTSTPIQSGAGFWLMSSKKYDTQGWTAITNTVTNLSPVSGYSLAMFSPATITMTGSYTHGATYNSGGYANTIPVAMTNGVYFMMGNPYPSTLDWDNESGWTKTNVNDAIYFWNPTSNSVASYVDGAQTNGGTRYISAMQSFLVKVPGGGGLSSLAVNNNARVLTNTAYFRTSSNQLARLVVKNTAGTMVDETVVRADDVATSDFDSDADASKIKGGLALYTKTVGSTEEYSINTLPITGPEMLVPLNLKVLVSGLYTIECSEYSIPGYSLVLEDKQTATYTLLDNSTIYTINANTTDNTDRFVLRFVAGLTTSVVSGSSSGMQISTYDNQLMLNVGAVQTDNGTIRIYDASGLAVMELKGQSIVSGIQVISLPGLAQGVYVAKVEVDGTTYVGKVVVK